MYEGWFVKSDSYPAILTEKNRFYMDNIEGSFQNCEGNKNLWCESP